MPYTGRSVADIRDSILADWSTAYTQLGRSLLIVEGSPAYLWASAIAIQLQGVEAQAEQIARDILPDEASDASLLRWGAVYAVERRPATAAEITVSAVMGDVHAPYGASTRSVIAPPRRRHRTWPNPQPHRNSTQ